MDRKAILLLAVVFATGCGAESDADRVEARVISIRPAQVTTKIVGASPEQRRVLRQIMAGFGPTRVEAVELVEPEDDMRAPPNGVALNVRAPRNDWLAQWHARLIGDVFYRRSSELDLPPVVWLGTEGGGHALGVWSARNIRGRALTLGQARDIAHRLRMAATANNAEVLRLELIRPQRLGFVVVLQADDPASFLLFGYEDVLKPLDELRGRGHEGTYLEVVDRNRDFVLRSGSSFSVREDVASCAPVLVLGGMSYDPPPCPVKPHWLPG
jgi:hypothetical protein